MAIEWCIFGFILGFILGFLIAYNMCEAKVAAWREKLHRIESKISESFRAQNTKNN